MTGPRLPAVAALSCLALVVPGAGTGQPATARPATAGRCAAGAHTLAPPGSRLYPDTGNGGYASLHTAVHMVYDATANRFLRGNHVTLTLRATQCLTSFSLDFERRSANKRAGPDLTVHAVSVAGSRAAFAFAQPTYPGDPHGQNDPDPAAHAVSQTSPVGGPRHNPLPPACSPELTATAGRNSQNGQQCPANKLVITPRAPLAPGSAFTVTVAYTGRPGVHNDGDGTTEGWFRARGGSFVTTEPVGTEDWLPLNDYPAAKPTYDFYDTVNAGKTAIGNGVLVSVTRHPSSALFPHGSATWHWHSAAPIASYLAAGSAGNYRLTERTADNGIHYYQAQDTAISAKQQRRNRRVMHRQEDITNFQSLFNGSYPFTSDGVVAGTPRAGFEEEMQTMITFAAGKVDLDILYHENMHQWWGDNVSESGYRMTFFKEGLATLGEYLFAARKAEARAGGPGSAAGQRAFERSLIRQFNRTYSSGRQFWTAAPSNPAPYSLFDSASTYERPGAAYIALREILGKTNFVQALQRIQRAYGGASITERQLEAAFGRWLPVKTAACQRRLGEFFTQWFDTAYPPGGGSHRPRITGPHLAGPGFYNAHGGCGRG